MIQKKKICSSCSLPQYIWKREEGLLYCQLCWSKKKKKAEELTSNDTSKIKQSNKTKKQYRIPPRSLKRIEQDKEYSEKRKQFLIQNQVCMINIPGVCSRQRTNQVHHTYSGKDREKYYLDIATWIATEDECHKWVHLHPIEAREMGFLK